MYSFPLYKLNLTSIYTYLGTRIGNRAYKTGASFFLLSRLIGAAAKLYLVCLILYTYVFQHWNVPFWSIAAVTVFLIWLYTKKSGIKTIIWTDTVLTFCLLAALVLIIIETAQILHLDFGGVVSAIQHNEHFRIFEFNDWQSRQNFFKQFFSGIFIVIVMTGLDQDMMQKNLSCKNLKEAQKNMYCYGFSFIPVNFLFLCLGILLLVLGQSMNLTLPALADDILPMFAAQGYLGPSVLILFSIGIIAASFSSSDSALTSLTTSFCVDILGIDKESEEVATKKRRRVHFGMSVALVLVIIIFQIVNNKSVIDAIYTIASYTYGPLLGLFAFGLFTRLQPRDKYVPYVAVASPVICYTISSLVEQHTGYKFGYEMLMFNGALTFAGLLLISQKNILKQEIWKS